MKNNFESEHFNFDLESLKHYIQTQRLNYKNVELKQKSRTGEFLNY